MLALEVQRAELDGHLQHGRVGIGTNDLVRSAQRIDAGVATHEADHEALHVRLQPERFHQQDVRTGSEEAGARADDQMGHLIRRDPGGGHCVLGRSRGEWHDRFGIQAHPLGRGRKRIEAPRLGVERERLRGLGDVVTDDAMPGRNAGRLGHLVHASWKTPRAARLGFCRRGQESGDVLLLARVGWDRGPDSEQTRHHTFRHRSPPGLLQA